MTDPREPEFVVIDEELQALAPGSLHREAVRRLIAGGGHQSLCTHGGDCKVHPHAGGLHDLDYQSGPLPELPAAWYEHPMSSATRCPDYPEGCGEIARLPKYQGPRRRGEAILRHREGCQVDTLIKTDQAELAQQSAEHAFWDQVTTGAEGYQADSDLEQSERWQNGRSPVEVASSAAEGDVRFAVGTYPGDDPAVKYLTPDEADELAAALQRQGARARRGLCPQAGYCWSHDQSAPHPHDPITTDQEAKRWAAYAGRLTAAYAAARARRDNPTSASQPDRPAAESATGEDDPR